MRWIDFIKDEAGDIADSVAGAVGGAVSAVTPDVIERNATNLVNNPVVGTAMNTFGPTRQIRNAVNFVANPTAANMLAASNPGNMTPGRPNRPTNPIGLAQQGYDITRYLGNAVAQTPGYFQNVYSPTVIAALNNISGPTDLGNVGRAGLAIADPYLRVANRPVEDYHRRQGGDAYAIAKTGGKRPADANTPYNIAADWAEQNPQEWPNIIEVYENGYDHDGDGEIDFIGDEAVWEYFIGLQNRGTRVGADIINDPWNATIGAASLGRGIAAGAQAGSRGAQIGRGIERTARAIDTVGELPFRALGAGARAVGLDDAARAVVRNIPGFSETQGSINRRLENQIGDTLRPVGEALEGAQPWPQGVPDWAMPQTGTGKYEVVTINAEPNRGAAYIVDPQGNPIPGTENAGKGKGVAKRLRDQAEKYNAEGGPEGVGTSPTVTNPRYRLPGQGESAAPNQSGITPFPEEVVPADATVGPQVVPDGPGVTNLDGTITELPDVTPDVPAVDPYDVSTPANFQQDRVSRGEAIANEGMSFNAPNVNDSRLTSVAESLRANYPNEARAFFDEIGLDPRTGKARPGSEAARVADADVQIGGRYTDDFAQKAFQQRVNAMRFVVDVEAPAFQQHFGVNAKPPLSGRAATANPIELANTVRALDAGNGARASAIGDLVTRAVLENDGAAWRVLSDLSRDFPWIADELPEIARLAEQSKGFTDEIADRFNLPASAQRQTDLAADQAPDPFASIDDPHIRLYLDIRAEEEAKLLTARTPKEVERLQRHIDEANDEIIGGLLRIADTIDPSQLDDISMDFVQRGYNGFPDAFESINRTYGQTPFPEQVVDDLPLDGTTPIDADGVTPFPDQPIPDTPSGPTTPMGEGTYTRQPDPGTQSLLETMAADGVIGREEFDFLSQPLPGQQAPLIDEFIDRLRNGMTANEAVRDLQGSITASGQSPAGIKRALHRFAGGINPFVRQSMQHNILNGLPGGIGDFLGNSMHLWQKGDIDSLARMWNPRMVWIAFNPMGSARSTGRAGSRGVSREFTRETNALLAGFDRELPEAILGPAALNDARFGDDDLILTKATRNRSRGTRTIASVFQNNVAQDGRKGIDALSRGVLSTQVLDDLLDPAVDRFRAKIAQQGLAADATIDAIRRHATDARAPEAWNARGGSRTMRSFSPEDVYAITGSDQLARTWRREMNGMYKSAGEEARKTFFAGSKRYGLDDAFAKTMFFHFWQSRALGLQLQSMIRSPRVLGGYYRMWQGAMNEADRNGYPKTFRGLTHYMGDTSAGFYSLFNPLGFLTPAMMFSDLGNQQGEGWANKFSSILPLTPMMNGTLAALGLLDNTPNMTGTQRIQNYVTDVINWANANALDFSLGGVIADPVQHWTQHIFEKINAGVQALGVPGAQRFEPYEPKNGRIDTIQSVVWHEAEADYGPSSEWTNQEWDTVQDALTAVETGGRGNERAEQAIRGWNDANMRNRLLGLITPQGSVLRYGPREEARNDRDDDPRNLTDGEQQRKFINASPENRALYVAQEQRDNLGTDRQRYFWETQQLILYGVDDLPDDQFNNWIEVGGQRITATQLRGMTHEQRQLVASAYTAEHNGTEELAEYRTLRNEFISNNPALSTYREYTGFVSNYQHGGTTGFRQWATTVSPEFKRRHDERADFFKKRGSSGAVLDEEMDRWAMSADAHKAFLGQPGSKYDARPMPGASPNNDPQGMLSQGSGSGSSSRSGSSSLADRIRRDLADYETESAAYKGGAPMPGLWGRGQENMYGPQPNMSAAARRYVAWAQGQPQGADTSPEAYAAWVETKSS